MELFYKELSCAYDRYIANAVASIIGTGAGLVNDSVNRDWNAEEAEKNRQFQREEREAAQQFNIDMWNMNNEYNSFKAQAERAREAGFAPDAILGNQSKSNPVTTSPQAGAQASFTSTMSPVLAQSARAIAETELLVAQRDKVIAEARGKKLENDFFSSSYEDRLKQIAHATKKMEIDNKSAEESFNWLAKFNEAQYETMLVNLNVLRISFLNEMKRGENLVKEGQLIDEKIETENTVQEGNRYNNLIDKYRAEFSKETGIALGTSEFEFNFQLWEKGKFNKYCNQVVSKYSDAHLKPSDKVVNVGKNQKTEDVDYSGRVKRSYRELELPYRYDPTKGTFSPFYDPNFKFEW